MSDLSRSCGWIAFAGALLAAGLPSTASAQSLSDAFRAALAHDPDFGQAIAERDAGRENNAQARALLLPKVQVQANGGYSDVDTDIAVSPLLAGVAPPGGNGASGGLLVQAQQPILDGEAAAQRRQLRMGARAAEAQFEAHQQQLAVRVAQAYFDVLAAEDALTSVHAQEESARREQRAAQARFDAGRAKITDVREAQARGDGAVAQIIALSAQRDLAAARYTELTGLDAAQVRPIRADLLPHGPAGALDEWQRKAEAQSPVVVANERRQDAARAKIDQYGWGARAKISAVGMYGRFWRDQDPSRNDAAIRYPDHGAGAFAGLQLRLPLYTGGGLESQRRQAAAQARAVGMQVDAARRDVRLQVQQAWLGQRSGVDRIAALRTALASANLQERAAVTGREVGVRTQNDVIAAQAQTIDAQRQLGDAMRDYELARLQLYAATGTLSPEQLADVDADLDATR